MIRPEHTIRGGFMTADPIGDMLRDANSQFEGEDRNLLNSCEEIVLRGMSLILRHPERMWAESQAPRFHDPSYRFLGPGASLKIPPVNYQIPDRQDPSNAQSVGLVELHAHVPNGRSSWERTRVMIFASPYEDQTAKSYRSKQPIIEATPAGIGRQSYSGPIPGRRLDVNFFLGVIDKIEEAVFPKK